MADFRFEPVLRYRAILEKMAAKKSADAKRKMQNIEDKIEKLKTSRLKASAEFNKRAENGVKGKDLASHGQYIQGAGVNIEQKERDLGEAEEELTKAVDELVQASTDKKAVEVLKEQFNEQLQYELRRLEEKELSDTAISMYNRKAEEDAGGSEK